MNLHTLLRQPAALVAGSVLAAVVLAGCGSSSSSSTDTAGGSSTSTPAKEGSYGPPAAGPHNAQDVTFVLDMLPHHTQAVEMADMALARDTTPEVKALAQQIKGAQAPEISAMGGWLRGWGEQLPAAHHMGGMSGGGHGMMSADQMTSLDKAAGPDFARMWLTDMTEHHTGALEMARTETAGGQSADARQLASSIISSQTAEIAEMTKLLAALPR
jgi:uncharacterized protein (DUF305 family)